MEFPKVKFTRNQLIFIVQTMLVSVFDTIQDSFEGRWMDGRYDEAWKKANDDVKGNVNVRDLAWGLTNNLSYNLSILAAQVTGEGMGNGDALDVPLTQGKLDVIIKTWATDWADGKRGIIPSTKDEQGVGRYDTPDDGQLATEWVNKVFADYLKIKTKPTTIKLLRVKTFANRIRSTGATECTVGLEDNDGALILAVRNTLGDVVGLWDTGAEGDADPSPYESTVTDLIANLCKLGVDCKKAE